MSPATQQHNHNFLEFHCGALDDSACFFNGTCVDEKCICPSGYGHDFAYFHFPNCVLHDGVYLIFAILYCTWSAIVLLVTFYNWATFKLRAKTAMIFLALASLANIGYYIFLVVDNGIFQVGSIMLSSSCAFTCAMICN